MAVRYSASDLHEQATIKSLAHTTNADFEEVAALTTVATVRGKYVPQRGRESMRAEQIDSEPRAMFVVRYREWLTTNHVIEVRGAIFDIHDVVDVEGRRRFQELVITERTVPYLTGEGEGEGEGQGPGEGEGEGGASYPVFETKSPAVTASNSASLDVAYPSGIQAGDDLFVVVGIDQDDAAGTAIPGFNQLKEVFADVGSQSIYAALFHKIATGAESGNATISFGNSANDHASAVMVRASGGDGNVTPLSSVVATGATAAPAAPGNVLDSALYLVFDMYVMDGNANFYDQDPTDFSNRHNSGADGTGLSISVASKDIDGDGFSTFGNEAHGASTVRQAIALSLAIKGA